MQPPRPSSLLATFATLTLIWGTTWAAIRIGLGGIPPFTGVALRFGIAAVVLFALVPVFRVRFTWSRREVGLWLTNAALAFCGSYGVVYWAEQRVPSGLASVLFSTYPIFVAGLAHVALPGERLRLQQAVGTLVGFGGVAVIYSEDFDAIFGPGVAFASAVMLVSPFVSAAASVAVRRWGDGIHPVSLTAIPMALTAVVMGAVALVFERGREVRFDAVSVGALFYLAILGSVVTFTLYYWLMSHVGATRVSMLAYTIPIVAVAVGTLFLDEPLPPRVAIGTGLVIAGVVLVGRLRRPTASPPAPPPSPSR